MSCGAGSRLDETQARIVRVLREFLDENSAETRSMPEDVARILDCVHQNVFLSSFNVTSARRECGIRNNNISTRFRSAVGISLRRYIENLRLRAARELLEKDPSEIYLIAMAVGYEHPETFHRVFRKRYRMTPRQHRELSLRSGGLRAGLANRDTPEAR